MNNKTLLNFLEEVSTPMNSNIINLPNGNSVACLEVRGTATSFSFKLQGIVDLKNEDDWSDIAYVSSTFTSGTNITEKGKYDFGVDGFSKIRVVLSSISGGNITVFGKAGA